MGAPRIGVAVGKGSSSMEGLKWALDKGNLRQGDTLHLLHVSSPGPVGPEKANGATLRKFQEKHDKKVEKLISSYKRACDKKEVKTEVHIGQCEVVYEGLVELILKIRITRIVIGSTEPELNWSFSSRGFKLLNATYVSRHTERVCGVVQVQRTRNGVVALELQNPSDVHRIRSQNNSFNSVLTEDAKTVSSWSSSRSEPEFIVSDEDYASSSNTTSNDPYPELIDMYNLPQSRHQQAMLEAEQQAKGMSIADTIAASVQKIVAEYERQRLNALKEAEDAKLQSLEHARRCEEQKQVLKKQCKSQIDALTNMIEGYKRDAESARKRLEELQKTVKELTSELEKETCRRNEAEERAMKAAADLRKAPWKYTQYTFKVSEYSRD